MSRRDLVRMTVDEVAEFLAEPHLCTIGTHGRTGAIHLVAMNYGFLDDSPAFWSYRKSQKIRNLERNPSISMLVHSGFDYAQLRGVQITGRADVRDDVETVRAVADSMASRYGAGVTSMSARESMLKRVAVRIVVDEVVSWDHTKLAGGY